MINMFSVGMHRNFGHKNYLVKMVKIKMNE